MQARIRKTDDIYCVELSGKISYESLEAFQRDCQQKLVGNKVVLNCEGLNFVGSIGITDFLVHLSALKRARTDIKYIGIAKEFRKLAHSFPSTKDLEFPLFNSVYEAIQSFRRGEIPNNVVEMPLRKEGEEI